MSEVTDKIKTFIKDCLAEYPVDADRIKVDISVHWGTVDVSLSKFGHPLFYSKEAKLAEIKGRSDIKAIALEVYETEAV